MHIGQGLSKDKLPRLPKAEDSRAGLRKVNLAVSNHRGIVAG